jgi:hypothetical protein
MIVKQLTAAAHVLIMAVLQSIASAPLQAAPPASAVVQEILDGRELFIEGRQAQVEDRALKPELVHTGDSRGQLRFGSGAAGRLNRFSNIRLGKTCFLLRGGQILVSGTQTGCVRSARLSVRGTNYVMGLTGTSGEAEVIVLEGEIEVQRLEDGELSDTPPVLLLEASRARLAADGEVLAVERLSRAAVEALLKGGLFQDFSTPLPEEAELQRSLRRNWPGLFLAAFPRPLEDLDSFRDPLVKSINAARADNGLSPLKPLPHALLRANITYAKPILTGILSSGRCAHDSPLLQAIHQRSKQNYPLTLTGEVIACPQPTRTWSADQIVAGWLSSPPHRGILLERPRASHIGCLRADAVGASLALCTIWSPSGSAPFTPR